MSVEEKITKSNKKYRLAIIASHPIQYQVPFFRELSASPEIDLTVFFCSDWGTKPYYDKGFGKEFKWDIPLFLGYHYEFLPNLSPVQNPSTFWGLMNFSIVKKLSKKSFDAVLIHGWYSFTNWLVMIWAFLIGLPVLLRCETNLLNPLPWRENLIKHFILEQVFKKNSGFLAIGTCNIEFYKAYGVPEKKIFLVPYAVDNDFFMSRAKELIPQKEKLKEKYGLPKELPVILFCGKLVSVKRPMDLLKVYEKLSKKLKAALVFVGDGTLRNNLETYTRENDLQHVYFIGFKNQTELPEFYAIADIFVLPSEFEPWGLVVNEAMCFGLPIIVSDKVGAGGDLVKEGVNGFVYPSKDFNSLAEKLEMLLSNRDRIRMLGSASCELVSKWSYREGVESILKCLKAVV